MRKLDGPLQERIVRAVTQLSGLDDPRSRLLPYSANLKGFWKFRVGDVRLVCQLRQRGGQVIVVVMVAHRSEVYGKRLVRLIRLRSSET